MYSSFFRGGSRRVLVPLLLVPQQPIRSYGIHPNERNQIAGRSLPLALPIASPWSLHSSCRYCSNRPLCNDPQEEDEDDEPVTAATEEDNSAAAATDPYSTVDLLQENAASEVTRTSREGEGGTAPSPYATSVSSWEVGESAPLTKTGPFCPWEKDGEGLIRHRVHRWFIPGIDIAQEAKQHAAQEQQAHNGAAGSNSSGSGTPPPSGTDVTFVPNILLSALEANNKAIKKHLMATLGSDFSKAGLHNDGIRTSFSAVFSQSIKQITGLKRIPPKLLVSCLVAPNGSFEWIDISTHPTATLTEYKESLQEVLIGLGMHQTMVEDSAQPLLLPQVTVVRGVHSILLRYAVESLSRRDMDSFQDLTNRFTIFVTERRIITVHRTQCTYVEELKMNWISMLRDDAAAASSSSMASLLFPQAKGADGNGSASTASVSSREKGIQYVLYFLVRETIATFGQAISRCIVEFDRYEAGLFSTTRNKSHMARDIYHIKRRASVYGRTLTLTQDAYAHLASSLQMSPAQVEYQEVMHDLAHVQSLSEELNSNADSVLQLLFQLSSYQVNELMRVLTLFSAFFIPLTFIAGVYGMNFENLPLLQVPHGELYCGALMGGVAVGIYFWFKAKHFI